MSKGRWPLAPKAERELRRLVREGELTATQIHQELDREGFYGEWKPSEKTIRRKIQDMTPQDDSGPWSLADFDPDDTRLILDILRVEIGSSLGHRWPTQEFARWLVRLRRTHPDMPGDWASALAWAYRRQAERGEDTRYLDMAVALKPWLSQDDYNRFVVVVRGSGPPPGSGSLNALRGVLADLEFLDTYEEDGMMVLDSDDLEKPLSRGNRAIMGWGWKGAIVSRSELSAEHVHTTDAEDQQSFWVFPDR